jgi:hypothetical protein
MIHRAKDRGYCLEMICADFLAGASIDGGNAEILLQCISRYYKSLPGPLFTNSGLSRCWRMIWQSRSRTQAPVSV